MTLSEYFKLESDTYKPNMTSVQLQEYNKTINDKGIGLKVCGRITEIERNYSYDDAYTINLDKILLESYEIGNEYIDVWFKGSKKVYRYSYKSAGKDNVEYKNSIGITDNPTVVYIKNFDAGGNLFFGYELANSLSFQLNTQLGLVNILPDYPIQDSDTNFKNTGFGLSVGYSF